MKNFIWPVTVLLASLLIGGSIFITTVLKLDAQDRVAQDKKIAEENRAYNEKLEKETKEYNLANCLGQAEKDYWSFMELNGTKKADGSITAATRFWDSAATTKKRDEDVCFKRYGD